MSKDKLVLLVGKSGSGKNYIINSLKDKGYNIKDVKSRTTREPRYKGEDTHIFVDESKYVKDKLFNTIIAYTFFNGNHYYTLSKDLEGCNIYIIDPDGVLSFKNYEIRDIIVVYLHCPFYKLIYRLVKRDGFKKGLKRFFHDIKKFKKIHYDDIITQEHAEEDLIQILELTKSEK